MKQNLINFLKYNKSIYKIYFYIANILLTILKFFVKTDKKLILFNSFAGRNYDDSPKAIFEMIKKDSRFTDYKLVWAFHNPMKFEIEGAKKIKTDSLLYFITALSSRVWVTNSSVERGLDFKGKNTFYLNTWHGTPIKLMGSDISLENESFHPKGKSKIDVMMSQSHFETEIFSKVFEIPKKNFLESGLPRNDILVNYSFLKKAELKKKLALDTDKKIILYCPTFREYEKSKNLDIIMKPPLNLKMWKYMIGDKYILLFRAHYEVSKVMDIHEDDFVRDMTSYPSLNDLMIVADVLISDYSSVFFDFSITGKAMLHFTYDYDLYSQKRGLYFDIRDYLPGSASEDELIEILKNLSCFENNEYTVLFREKFVNFYGNATLSAVNRIAKELAS